jgi:hypothetical protein
LTINTSALLVPPLEHPTSLEPPLGVCTAILTDPGPEMTPVVSVTFNWVGLATVAARVFPLIATTEDETNWLPFTVRTTPCCTWAKLTELGDSDPITGTGRELPQSGLRVLLQPAEHRARKATRDRPHVRENMEALLFG